MDTMTLTMLIIGGIGVLLVALSLVLGEFHLDGHPDGPFSLPVVSAFVGAFGFVGAIPAALIPESFPTGARLAISLGAGLIAAVPLAIGAGHLVRMAMGMRTDATLAPGDLLGSLGTVITPIPAGGFGEVRLHSHGQDLKYNARSASALPAGGQVYVVDVPTATSVEVVAVTASAQPELSDSLGREPALAEPIQDKQYGDSVPGRPARDGNQEGTMR